MDGIAGWEDSCGRLVDMDPAAAVVVVVVVVA
jgi:hypothetical protein